MFKLRTKRVCLLLQEEVVRVQRAVRRPGLWGAALHEDTPKAQPAPAAHPLVTEPRHLQVTLLTRAQHTLTVLTHSHALHGQRASLLGL